VENAHVLAPAHWRNADSAARLRRRGVLAHVTV
jgi:hypothetical protein